MKKLFYFLLLLPFFAIAQVSTGMEQEFDYGIKNNAPQTVTTSDFITTTGTGGTQGRILGENISLSVIPPTTHYVPTSANLKGHFQGIDAAIGNIVATTAGITNRVWYTADPTTITAGTFYLTNATGKGTVASAIQTVINNDNEKKYFAQDLIGNPFAANTLFPPGVYAGNLSASTTPNSAQQRYTVELYKCNNAGTPIASGVSGAPVGSLGVTVIVVLDSGLVTLADNSVTNVPVNGNLVAQFSIATGERIRYHVSAEKVGTAGANITQGVYYGTSYNSFLDVPVTFNTTSIVNVSSVVGATSTDAFNTLNTGKQNVLTNPITGTGTTNTLPKFTGVSTLGNSSIIDNGGIDVYAMNSSYSVFGIKGSSTGDIGGGLLSFRNQTKTFAEITGETESANNGAIFIRSLTSGSITEKARIVSDGSLIVNTTTNNAQGKLQVNGNITCDAATLSNQAVIKSQHDLKADLDSPTFTSDPKAPTATAGDNDTSIATTAFVQAALPVVLTASSVIDFPSIASGSSYSVVISVPGASVGDVVAIGIPYIGSADSRVVYRAIVASVNQVDLRCFNYSASSADPDSGTFKVKVLK